MDPFLKSVGGKSWLVTRLVPEIMRLEPDLYVEPFVGGGAIALTLSPTISKRVNDANPSFANVWATIGARTPEDILTALAAVERAYPNTAFGYAQARDELNTCIAAAIDPRDQSRALRWAALTLYINARSFNGLWRVNQEEGLFNVPWGKYKDPRRLTLAELRVYHHVVEPIVVSSGDFRIALDEVMPRGANLGVVIYADPPYDSPPDDRGRKSGFTGYTKEGFDETDQRDLATWLKYAARRGARVFTTNADTPLIRELYAWAQIERVSEYHSVGSNAARRGERHCLLIRG